MAKVKSIEYNGATITLRIEVHTGSNPAPDNDPFAVQWNNTLTVQIEGDADTIKVYDKVPDLGLIARIEAITGQMKAYIDSQSTIETELVAAGFEDE